MALKKTDRHAVLTWSLTLKEECRLREFENRDLRIVFGPMGSRRDRGVEKLLHEELNALCCSSNNLNLLKTERRPLH
jgi:hypothetical protein